MPTSIDVGIVVVAIHCVICRADVATEFLAQRFHHVEQHEIAIQRRVVLRPQQTFDVFVELGRAFVQPSQVTVGQMYLVLCRQIHARW